MNSLKKNTLYESTLFLIYFDTCILQHIILGTKNVDKYNNIK